MSNAINRITSYDFLGMFIPGSVGLAMIVAKIFPDILSEKAIVLRCGCEELAESSVLHTTIEMLMFFAGAYIAGLIINWISDGIWKEFRNYDAFIELQAQKLIQRNPGYRWIEKEFNVVPLESHCCCGWIVKLLECYIMVAFHTIRAPLSHIRKYTDIEKRYYHAYYWLLERQKVTSVSVIESQVTLLRNMLLPLSVGFFFLPCPSTECLQLVLLWFSVLFTMVSRQNRIYSLILEDYQNYKEMETNK